MGQLREGNLARLTKHYSGFPGFDFKLTFLFMEVKIKLKKYLPQLVILVCTFYLGSHRSRIHSCQPSPAFCVEDSIRVKESESLQSLAHKYMPTKFFPYLHTGYHRFYDKLFEPLRHKRIKFLEIGLDNGNGSLLWEEYFTNAEFHGIEYSRD